MNILFIVAHPDDEAYGPAGTMAKLVDAGHNITVACLCRGNRPGATEVEMPRQRAFHASCKQLGVKTYMGNGSDLHLDYHEALADVEAAIMMSNPEVVYTHNISDINKDHRIAAEVTMAACRPKYGSAIRTLYMFETPSSTEWSFSQIEPVFVPTTFVDITPYIDFKKSLMALYPSEIHQYPDARSVQSMEIMAQNRGRNVGLKYAEAFKLVFDICKQ